MRDSRHTSSSHTSAQSIVENLLAELKGVPLHAAQRLHQLSTAAEQEHRLDDALIFANAHLSVARDTNATQSIILALLTRGKLLFKTSQFENAIPDLREALHRSSNERSLPDVHRTHILYTACNLIGASLWKNGDRVSAALALKETTRLARARFGTGSAEVVKSLFDQVHLAIEMRRPKTELLDLIDRCVREPSSTPDRATRLTELGEALYMNCMWDTASYTLQIAARVSDIPHQKTRSLLALANIALFKSDIGNLHRFVDQAESFWMDVAPRPHIERHIASLRALAALHEGCEETYREQITKAQQQGELEELSIESRVQIQFVRAQVLRRSGLHEEARQEIEEASRILARGIVSPLTRCSMYLQQAFCEQVEGGYAESNTLIDAALEIARCELDNNVIIEARGRSLKAHNLYSIFTYSDTSLCGTNTTLNDSKENAETALRILNEHNIDHYSQKTLLRLLSGISNHLGLDAQQVSYDRRLAMLEAQYPDVSR